MIWTVSDLHFNHRLLAQSWGKRPWKHLDNCEYSPEKQFSCNCDVLQRMNEGLIENWNQYIKPEDEVWHLGDLCFQPKKLAEENKQIIFRLNGNIKYILGNHDSIEGLKSFGIDRKNIFQEEFITLGGIKFLLSHFPYYNGMKLEDKTERPYAFTRNVYENGKLVPLICGHVHDRWALVENCLNVGWDIWGKPISELEILDIHNKTNGFTKNLELYNEI